MSGTSLGHHKLWLCPAFKNIFWGYSVGVEFIMDISAINKAQLHWTMKIAKARVALAAQLS